MINKNTKVLIYGYGNPGRQDDGAGIILAEEIANWAKENNFSNIKTDINYQLNIEDAFLIKDFDTVIFTDASIEEDIKDYKISELKASEKTEFTMHAVSPAFILYLCQQLYNKKPKSLLTHIKGYNWEFKEGCSKQTVENIKKAKQAIIEMIA